MARVSTRRRQWVGCTGCLLALAGLGTFVVWVATSLDPRIIPVSMLAGAAVAAPVVALVLLRGRGRAAAAFRAAYGAMGKDMLIVYTDSPHWREYIESRWLPRWGARAIVFDRSKPWTEARPEARLWRAVAGSAEHTPVVIVIPPRGRVQIVRFFLAFRDYKHGKDRRLRDAEARLARILGETTPE